MFEPHFWFLTIGSLLVWLILEIVIPLPTPWDQDRPGPTHDASKEDR